MGESALSWRAITFGVLLALFVVVRFWQIAAFSLWGGEAFTMIGVSQSWRGMLDYIVADIVHPPLMYVLLKTWITMGGQSILWLKLFPVLPGIAVVVPFYYMCRELNFRLPEINLALLMIAVNGYLVHYAQELRMYSLVMFLAMCSFWLFIRFTKSTDGARNDLLVVTAVNLLAIYTHYYGWVVVGMEFLFLLIWHRKKVLTFGLSVLFLFLCFAPWAYLVTREARSIGGLDQNLDWIPRPSLTDLLNLYATFNGPLGDRYVKLLGLLLFGLPLLNWAWSIVRDGVESHREESVVFTWLALLAFLPVIAIFLVSQRLAQAVWIDRYFIIIAIPYLMLVAVAVFRIRLKWARHAWVVAIVLWSLLAGFNDLRTNRMAWESPQLGSRVDWDGLVQQMVAAEVESSQQTNVYTLTVISLRLRTGDWALSTSLNYFLDLRGEERFRTVYARDVHSVLEMTQDDHFWVAFFELEEWPQPSPAVVLADNGYRIGGGLSYQEGVNRVVILPVWRE